ncbi:MAG: HAD family hydrolase [Promethearchaeota archaeon]
MSLNSHSIAPVPINGAFTSNEQNMNSTHPPIIIFDVDGVLLDSKGHFLAALDLMHDPTHHWNYEAIQRMTSIDFIRLLESGTRRRSLPTAKAMFTNLKPLIPGKFRRIRLLLKLRKHIDKFEWKYTNFIKGVKQTLETLVKKGIIIGAASNSEAERIKKWFKIIGIEKLFSLYISRDERKVYGVKPSPRPILALLLKIKRQYNLGKINKKRVAFVGDLGTDIIAGREAGIKAIGVLSGHSTKGELELYSPDFILKDINEIPARLNDIFPSV